MSAVVVSIEIDANDLDRYEDTYLATLWHVAQINPAPFGDKDAGELVERIGREIIRRWLGSTRPELWNRQGEHHYWDHLRQLGSWKDGEFVPYVAPVPVEGDVGEVATS